MASALDLEVVREFASKHHLVEIYLNIASRVISFCDQGNNFRVNVYNSTGTVGTCVNHPVIGKSQLFRQNVSLKSLTYIFRNPRVHTGHGYYRSKDDVLLKGYDPADGEETALISQIQLLKEQLNEYTAHLIALRVAEEQKKKAREESERLRLLDQEKVANEEQAERLASYVLPKQIKHTFEREWVWGDDGRGIACDWQLKYCKYFPSDITDVSCVAIGDGGYIVVSDRKTCTGYGPRSSVREYVNKHNKDIEYIAIGPNKQYYIEKTTGQCKCAGPEDFCKTMESKNVDFVSFGPWGIWYVKFTDGDAQWNIASDYDEHDHYDSYYSDDLVSILANTQVQALYLGRDGKYFVAYDNHKISFSGMPSSIMKHLTNR